ncbi:hypothetical protein TI04_10540 [Achromatium sp. WMS2]|nr:hypothetical protein TI04_10540 [Achromatium sp. WMS2]
MFYVLAIVLASCTVVESVAATSVNVTLECYQTEDSGGPDEARLDITIDGGNTYSERKSMNNHGTPWSLAFSFNNNIRLQLWDEDAGTWIDPHDELGTFVLDTSQVTKTLQFTDFRGHGSHYRVFWSAP